MHEKYQFVFYWAKKSFLSSLSTIYCFFFVTDCKDQYGFCVDLKSKWCSNSFVKVNCKKSCNLCPTTTCEDLATKRNCNYWRGLRYCTTGNWIQYMRTNCKKTCGHC